jgi:hypothetical protein
MTSGRSAGRLADPEVAEAAAPETRIIYIMSNALSVKPPFKRSAGFTVRRHEVGVPSDRKMGFLRNRPKRYNFASRIRASDRQESVSPLSFASVIAGDLLGRDFGFRRRSTDRIYPS